MQKFCSFLSRLRVLPIGVILVSSVAAAARLMPEPLFDAFTRGYGVVAVSVVRATPTGRERQFDVSFRVEKVIALPVSGGNLPCKDGDEINVPLGVGYGDVIEDF